MKTSSAKAKGRLACQLLRDALLEWSPDLKPDDIRVTPASVAGVDLMLSPAAQERYPFAIEVKNQETLNIWASYAQAQAHAKGTDLMPLLAFKRNRSDMMICLSMDDFFKLIM